MAPSRKGSTRKASSTSSDSSTSSAGDTVKVTLAHPVRDIGEAGEVVEVDAATAARLEGAGYAKAAG